jgi:sugar phosphate isomerase/epimerase
VNGFSSRSWSLAQDIAFYKTAGIRAVTLSFAKFQPDVDAGVAAIKASDVRPVLMASGAAITFQGGLDVLKAPIDAASAMGCAAFYSVSGPTLPRASTDDAYAALVRQLAPITAYAQSKGVRLAIENNSIATRGHGFIHTFADAADLARDTGLGICLELQNCWYERGLARLFKQNVGNLVMVQVSDFKVGEDLRLNRCVPGDGSIPLEWMLERLLDAGYGGYFDIELLGPHIEAEGYPAAIDRAVDWLSERLQRWGV